MKGEHFMKIKVSILDDDLSYLNRITLAFTNRFADKIEIHSFTNQEIAMSSLISDRIDVFIASNNFEIDVSSVPKRCGFAYFVDSPGIEEYKEQKTISRYQKAEVIYKEIINIYSETVPDVKFEGSSNAYICTFFSTSGGVGSSSVAAAYAMKLARSGKKTLYLNLEEFGNSELFFNGEGQANFSDVIFSLKSKKTNLALKLESFVKEDASGVNFFSVSRTALDMLELSEEDLQRLFSGIKLIGSYDFVVVDADFAINKKTFLLFNLAQSIIFVSDGSEISNDKFIRAQQALQLYEQQNDVSFLSKASLLYNRFSNKTGKIIENNEIHFLGGINRFEHATTIQVVEQISKLEVLNDIFNTANI